MSGAAVTGMDNGTGGQVLVRAAMAADVAAISEICTRAYRVTYADLLPEAYRERTIAQFFSPGRIARAVVPDPPGWLGYQVVTEGGTVRGGAGAGMVADGSAELFVLYLDPDQRNRGFGSALLDHIIGQVRGYGAREITALVTEGNERGLPFYRARGFSYVATVPASDALPGESFTNMLFRRPLD